MRTSQLEHEYDSTVHEFGRRVANRWLYATMQQAGKKNFSLNDFYAMYGSEGGLPESERTRPGDAELLDVTRWHSLYALDNEQRCIDAAARIEGTTRDWIAELRNANPAQRKYLRALVLGNELWDDVPQEWRDFESTTNNADAFVLFVLFTGRWPRVDGEAHTLHPNEVQIAGDFAVRDESYIRSLSNGTE